MTHLSTKQVAEMLGIAHWQVQRLYELGDLDSPVVAGRRIIPSTEIPAIIDAARARGYMRSEQMEAHA